VHELGVWFTKHPAHFIESGFLPYLGKTLSDHSANVRLEAVKAIFTLYSKKDYIVAVNHFTHTFKPRLVEMAVSDIEISVRLAVIEILLSIDQLGFLEPEEREQICLLIFGQDQRVRSAVAPFIQLSWAEEMDEQLTGRALTGEEGERERQRAGAKCLASLLLKWSKSLDENTKTKQHNHNEDEEDAATAEKGRTRSRLFDSITEKVNNDRIGLAVESLWDDVEFIRKWNALLELLLLDHSQQANSGSASQPSTTMKGKKKGKATQQNEAVLEEAWRLSDEEEDVLLQVLVAALRRATEDAKGRKKV
jgi:cohesin complex subunit SA-1/2